MQLGPNPLPAEADFLDPRSQDLDERHAVKMFLGKTPEEAEAMFDQNFLYYQENLVYMRARAFQFYVLPAIKSLLSDPASGDSDAASTFCSVLESKLEDDPGALMPIAPVVLNAIETILADFDRFDCSPEIYGDVPARYRSVAARLGARFRERPVTEPICVMPRQNNHRLVRWTWRIACVVAMATFLILSVTASNPAFSMVMFGAFMIASAVTEVPALVVRLRSFTRDHYSSGGWG